MKRFKSLQYFAEVFRALGAFLSFLWKRTIEWLRGYTVDQRKLAFQVFLAFIIVTAITAPRQVWDALSYGPFTPPIALVFILLTSPEHQGGVTLSVAFVVGGILLGGGCALLITYITNAAISFNWAHNTALKGTVFTLLTSIVAFGFNAIRWRFELTNLLFLLACAALIFAGGISTYYLPEVLYLQIFHSLALILIGSGTMALVAWFVFPITSGSLYREAIAKTMRSLASAIETVQTLMLGPIDPESGLLSAAVGKIDPLSGTDEGLSEIIGELRQSVRAAKGSLFSSWAFHIPARLEIDVYNRPKLFPRYNYVHIRMCINLLISTVAVLVRPLKQGKMDLRLLHAADHPELKTKMADLLNGMQKLMLSLADCLESKSKFKNADNLLEKLDATWLEFLDEAVLSIDACTTADAAFALRTLAAFMYLMGSRIRAVYTSIAGGVAGRDPEAVEIAVKRLQTTPGWVKSADAFRNPLRDNQAVLETMQKAAEGAESEILVNLVSKRSMKHSRSFAQLLSAAAAPKAATERKRRAFRAPIWVIMGIQYAVALGFATALAVVPVIAEKGFHGRPGDVVVTVAVTWMVRKNK